MKIALLSDLHFQRHLDKGYSFIKALDPIDVDILVLAGDIMSFKYFDEAHSLLDAFLAKYKKIIYVAGNHEFYGCSPKHVSNVVRQLRDKLPSDRIHIFDEPGRCVIDGQEFICGTMWYEYKHDNYLYDSLLNDKVCINGFIPWVYEQNELFKHLANGNITNNSIVITHYLPSYECVAPEWKGDELNRFFVCEMDELIKERRPRYWIAGHTHTPFDLKINETRVVGNPFGYPKESKSNFKDKLIIEV